MIASNLVKHACSITVLALSLGATAAYAQSAQSSDASSKNAQSKQPAKGGSVSKADQKMMEEMAYSNLAEIETGKLAQSKSQSEEVKKFAQQMIDDHTKSQQELQQLAESKGVKLPTEPDKKHQAMAKKMSGMSGEEFDRMYMKQVGVEAHQKTHKLLQQAQKNAKDGEVKSLAQKNAPIVEEHLKMAKEQTQSGKSSSMSGSSDTKGKSDASK